MFHIIVPTPLLPFKYRIFRPRPMYENADQPGSLRWNLVLGPKEKGKITFGYKVKYPYDVRVTGLE
jgi:hypothetical protein